MVVEETLIKHLEELRAFLKDLDRYKKGISQEQLLKDRDTQNMVLYALLEAIQSCIDLGSHIVAEKKLRRPETYKDVFRVLCESNLIEDSLRDKMMELAGFRNIVIHIYWKVDIDEVYRILQEEQENLRNFAKVVESLL